MSKRASVWFTPQFLLTVVIVGAYCVWAIAGIVEGEEVVQSWGILVGLPLFAVMLGLAIRHQIRSE